MKTTFLFLLGLTVFLTACRKDSFITGADANVRMTADTIRFDTVFTASGSVTKSFKIINENNRKLRLSGIELAGGSASPFKINVDGVAANSVTDLEVEANDSVYVFVQVSVDPSAGTIPFVLRDSISVLFNGTKRIVQLEAWGQNAHFLRNTEINNNATWTDDLPYVILGYLRVNENATLNIEKGCRVFVHADAPVVVNGTLHINGGADSSDRVRFSGDRLDEPYKNFPASWPGIYFGAASEDNSFRYAVISNAYQAITVQGEGAPLPALRLESCIIDNAYDAGLTCINASVSATNLLISNCGKNLRIGLGGLYRFTNCTFAATSTRYIGHQFPVTDINNSDGTLSAAMDAVFTNCIFWGVEGVVENEVVTSKTGTNPYSVIFDHVLWRIQSSPAAATVNAAANDDPLFLNTDAEKGNYNFRLNAGSPGIDAGTPTSLTTDLDGNARPVALPDLGAYEKQP